MKLAKQIFSLTLITAFLAATSVGRMQKPKASDPGALAKKIRRFSPTVLMANTSRLSVKDRQALQKIIAAAKYMDPLFLRQVWSGNESLRQRLEADRTPAGRMLLKYFLINDGPWSRLDENEAFIDDVPKKPAHANYYPDDITKEEFNAWVETLPAAEKVKATGYFYTIRRDANRKLMTVPYNQEYHEFLEPAAKLLREAAALTTNATLRDFLNKRAAAFASNDYYDSDVAWMDLDAPIDVTIGPYETYEDELFGYKAAFEAYVTMRDDAETAKLKKFSQYLQELEDNRQIVLRYVDSAGRTTEAANPNGSLRNIAGIVNARRNVFGLMPHPEHACEALCGGVDGASLFRSVRATLTEGLPTPAASVPPGL